MKKLTAAEFENIAALIIDRVEDNVPLDSDTKLYNTAVPIRYVVKYTSFNEDTFEGYSSLEEAEEASELFDTEVSHNSLEIFDLFNVEEDNNGGLYIGSAY